MSALLREAEIGQTLRLILVDNEPRDLAAPDVEQVRCRRPHFPEIYSARLAVSMDVEEHKDALAIKLQIRVHLSAVVLPSPQIGAPGRSHCGQPSRAARYGGATVKHEFDLQVRPLCRAEVAPPPRLVDRADQFHVRLRHRPRSISQAQESA